ncbi:hypothetical protein HPB47_023001 [Ixodes persulcatus]|uniref:Uncharacterized protein n=1 Tax=Ixodes persulcatus TaxID=34615 RepID=A0AC60Q9A8_IXOPE|nr:hypothetical protein HPB47_023001 [Ixodes persulcatus]
MLTSSRCDRAETQIGYERCVGVWLDLVSSERVEGHSASGSCPIAELKPSDWDDVPDATNTHRLLVYKDQSNVEDVRECSKYFFECVARHIRLGCLMPPAAPRLPLRESKTDSPTWPMIAMFINWDESVTSGWHVRSTPTTGSFVAPPDLASRRSWKCRESSPVTDESQAYAGQGAGSKTLARVSGMQPETVDKEGF